MPRENGLKGRQREGVTPMKKTHWYRLFLTGIFLFPAIIFQSIIPLVSFGTWESLAEDLYRQSLSYLSPLSTPRSKVVVVEIDQKTWDAYGWPIDRQYYIKALEKLKKSGHPWILSLLQFQDLEKRSGENREKATSKDQALAKEISSYERYIGSGLMINQGSVLDADQEDKLLPKILLSSSGKVPTEIPELPLSLVEGNAFVAAQRSFGFGARFGTEPIINCMQSYLTDAGHRGDFVILSSVIWAASYASQFKIATKTGAGWPRTGEKVPFPFTGVLEVAYKICDHYPGVITQDYLSIRGIERISMVDLIDGSYHGSLADKIVVLASSEMRTFRGPGLEKGQKSATTREHLLVARFLDHLVNQVSILRGQIKEDTFQGWLPIFVGFGLFLLSFFAGPVMLCIVTALGLLASVTIAFSYLSIGEFFIPIQTIYSLGVSLILVIVLVSYLRYYGIKRQMEFTRKLNESLSQCNTLTQIQDSTRGLCTLEFKKAKIDFLDYDVRFYEASNNPQAALELLETPKLALPPHSSEVPETFANHGPLNTVMTSLRQVGGGFQTPWSPLNFQSFLAVTNKSGRLGTVRVAIEFEVFEQHFVLELINNLRHELGQHWNRVKLLADQKLLDYKILAEQSRGKILGRFLTQVLVSKFTNSQTMEENLKLVLTPRVTRTALMQADIRGYSKVSAMMAPLEMVQLLQGYYRGVVDAAQLVAQVKLIGDCIFLFIEEEAAPPGKSPVDLALELSQILVESTEKQNIRRVETNSIPMNFGIAIHYGEVVVGNLSSDECIDYTVIGTDVNFVARLEELTKNPGVSQAIGPNGVVLSEEAYLNLKAYNQVPTGYIDLKELGLTVRSFPEVKSLYGISSAQIKALGSLQETVLPLKLAS